MKQIKKNFSCKEIFKVCVAYGCEAPIESNKQHTFLKILINFCFWNNCLVTYALSLVWKYLFSFFFSSPTHSYSPTPSNFDDMLKLFSLYFRLDSSSSLFSLLGTCALSSDKRNDIQGVHKILCFSFKFLKFSEFCQFCCSAGYFTCLACVERKQSPENILKSSKKHNILWTPCYFLLTIFRQSLHKNISQIGAFALSWL